MQTEPQQIVFVMDPLTKEHLEERLRIYDRLMDAGRAEYNDPELKRLEKQVEERKKLLKHNTKSLYEAFRDFANSHKMPPKMDFLKCHKLSKEKGSGDVVYNDSKDDPKVICFELSTRHNEYDYNGGYVTTELMIARKLDGKWVVEPLSRRSDPLMYMASYGSKEFILPSIPW